MDSSLLSEPGPSRGQQPRATSIAVVPQSHPRQQRHPQGQGGNGQDNAGDANGNGGSPNAQQRDVYAHPAAVAYAQSHPRRTIPRFGPYLLLQTLGEGEFGKVKLGLHSSWGEEVAVKLIRRTNIDSNQRMVKVEREIEVLRNLKHPNIVRLYDVIETDKYIGIILEYASGGELFDHILAHRYLKEKDAAKLFAQLISGVWYIHQKKIVHRDLKLENLLLDRHRNVIITDFGFANKFEAQGQDLMATSCGSPCYAAPELVISEGNYVGTAVDIWSCGVILYAMLAGYLPFDDDPANPEGDNINLLYRYIVNTPLSFPDYVSTEARDILKLMLVPDPTQRANLDQVMAHPWLGSYVHLFGRSVDELEKAALDQQQAKRLAYQQNMRKASSAQKQDPKMSRSQSARPETFATPAAAAGGQLQPSQTQPEYVYETSMEATPARRAHQSAIVQGVANTHQSPKYGLDDDPFGPTPSKAAAAAEPTPQPSPAPQVLEAAPSPAPVAAPLAPSSPEKKTRRGDANRHTVQVEVSEPAPSAPAAPSNSAGPSDRRRPSADKGLPSVPPSAATDAVVSNGGSTASRHRNRGPPPSSMVQVTPSVQDLFTPPQQQTTPTPSVSVSPASPPGATHGKNGHQRGSSISKIFGGSRGNSPPTGAVESSPVASRVPSDASHATSGGGASPGDDEERGWYRRKPSKDSGSPAGTTATGKSSWYGRRGSTQVTSPGQASTASSQIAAPEQTKGSVSSRSSRRNTLTVMVEPFRNLGKKKDGQTPTTERAQKDLIPAPAPPATAVPTITTSQSQADKEAQFDSVHFPPPTPVGMPAGSTSKSRGVMGYFQSKKKRAEESGSGSEAQTPITPAVVISPTTPTAAERPPRSDRPKPQMAGKGTPGSGLPSTPSATKSIAGRMRESLQIVGSVRKPSSRGEASTPSAKSAAAAAAKQDPLSGLRLHEGFVDTKSLTSANPHVVFAQVKTVLQGLGLEMQQETEWKYRCVRAKRKGVTSPPPGGVAAYTMVGSAGSAGIDRRGLPAPGGMLRGLLMRRQSSQVAPPLSPDVQTPMESVPPPNADMGFPLGEDGAVQVWYGPPGSGDSGEEIRFAVELTKIAGLKDVYSLDMKRLKGRAPTYGVIHDAIKARIDLRGPTDQFTGTAA